MLVLAWQWTSSSNGAVKFAVGAPFELLVSAHHHLLSAAYWSDIGLTVSAAFVGFCVGTLLGGLVGLATALNPIVQRCSKLYIAAFASVPVVVFSPLLVLLVGIGWSAKVWLAVLAAGIVATQTATFGASEAMTRYGDRFRRLGATQRTLMQYVLLPGAFNSVLDGIRGGIGAALVAVFLGEFINSEAGLGHFVLEASGVYRMNDVWFGVITFAVISLTLSSGIEWSCKRFLTNRLRS
jgi:NitT/TauT family transport system permease protein